MGGGSRRRGGVVSRVPAAGMRKQGGQLVLKRWGLDEPFSKSVVCSVICEIVKCCSGSDLRYET
jgi:hypothetical protein